MSIEPAFSQPEPGRPPGRLAEQEFRSIEQRLRELGATYYLLETWGDEGELFRFQGRIAVMEDPSCQRYFEAVDREPLVTMRRVLAQVEAWKSATVR